MHFRAVKHCEALGKALWGMYETRIMFWRFKYFWH